MLKHFLFLFAVFVGSLQADAISLKDLFQEAKVGDYIATQQNKSIAILHIVSVDGSKMYLDEVVGPASLNIPSFRSWMQQMAPGNTSWVRYQIDLTTGNMLSSYSFTRGLYFEIPEAENFLSRLLTLSFERVPTTSRKRTGGNRYWQPELVFEGETWENITFSAWRCEWPKDGSELAGKTIEIYLPEQAGPYPSYFPYWLQVSGVIGKAKVRIIDSGRGLNLTYRQTDR